MGSSAASQPGKLKAAPARDRYEPVVDVAGEQLAAEDERLRLVHEIPSTVVSHLDAKELFVQISKCIGRVIQYDYCSLGSWEPENEYFRIRGLDLRVRVHPLAEETIFPAKDSPAGKALITRNPVLTNRLRLRWQGPSLDATRAGNEDNSRVRSRKYRGTQPRRISDHI